MMKRNYSKQIENTMSEYSDLSGIFFELIRAIRRRGNIWLFCRVNRFLCRIKGVKLGRKVNFNGYPIISRAPNSTIRIGDRCTFNSAKRSVRIMMNRRCTFSTTLKGAEIHLGENVGLSGVIIVAREKVRIGDNVMIGAYSTIIDNDFHNSDPKYRYERNIPSSPVTIEDGCFIGMNCMILKGVRIGKNSVIAANSVVLSSIPPNSVAIGNPCKVMIKRNWAGLNKDLQ